MEAFVCPLLVSQLFVAIVFFKLVPNYTFTYFVQTGFRLATDWYKDSTRLVLDWCENVTTGLLNVKCDAGSWIQNTGSWI